jgi:ParB family chromosome partitioning protein
VAPKFGLGKGVEALFAPDDENSEALFPDSDLGSVDQRSDFKALSPLPNGKAEISIPLDKLIANPGQPRRYFDEESLAELADSIRQHGIIQPIIAEDAGDGTYIIVAGERRSRAARLAGLTEVPALIRDYTDEKRMEIALIENVQRADLNPIEEASAYRKLMELTGISQDEVAARVGKKRPTVANALRLLKLPPAMQEALENGALSPGHARAILSVESGAVQETLFREICDKGLSVREAEKRAAELTRLAQNTEGQSSVPAGHEAPQKRDPELIAIEQQFIETLGTKVSINGSLERGSIHIDYYSMEDLDRLYEILKGN